MMPTSDPTADLPRALGGPFGRAVMRATPADFQVVERLDIPVHPTGAHWWLQIRKQDWNTRDVARELAGLAGIRLRQLGYAGLKDRHAVATQWFSLPIATLDPETLQDRLPPGLTLCQVERARHAIRRGGLRGNHFRIVLRDLRVDDETALAQALEALSAGVPNYFGAQRFGLAGGNLEKARRWLTDPSQSVERFERGLLISAARSWLFNQVLAERVRQKDWDRLLPGEAVILHGSRSCFPFSDGGDNLDQRLAEGDIHPSGPLPGLGESPVSGDVLARELATLATEPALLEGLETLGLKAERRALRLRPEALAVQRDGGVMVLDFELPKGCFATAVLRELFVLASPPAGQESLSP